MTRRRLLDDTGLARRNHALEIIRADARRGPWDRKPVAYDNARRIPRGVRHDRHPDRHDLGQRPAGSPVTGPRRLGPAWPWELELDSLADRLAADTSRQHDPAWRARVAALPACYGATPAERQASVIRRAIQLVMAGQDS